MDAPQVKKLIEDGLECETVEVESPDNTHFMALIVSSQFEGLNRIARHQKVYAALGELIGGEIHALSMTTRTPAEHG